MISLTSSLVTVALMFFSRWLDCLGKSTIQTVYRSLVWNQTRDTQLTSWDAAADLCIDPDLEHGWFKFSVWDPSLISFPLHSVHIEIAAHCGRIDIQYSMFYAGLFDLYLIIQGCQNFFCPKAESRDVRCQCCEVHRTDLLCIVSVCPLLILQMLSILT